MPARKVFPLPGIVRKAPFGRDWIIQEPTRNPFAALLTGAAPPSCTDIAAGKMIVPLDDSDSAHASRVHEMLHARFSPTRPPEGIASQNAILAGEDARIAMLGAELDLPLFDPPTAARTILGALQMVDAQHPTGAAAVTARRLIGLRVCSLGPTDAGHASLRAVAKYARANRSKWLPPLIRAIREAFNCFERWRPYARSNDCLPDIARMLDDLFPEETEPAPMLETPPMDSAAQYALQNSPPMLMDAAPLCERLAPRTIRPRVKHQDFGAVLRAPHRWAVDRAVFRTTQRRPGTGGTILIDGSGSMALSQADLERLLRARPAATIAIYNGEGYAADPNHKAALRILARNGRRVAARHVAPPCDGHHNSVDAPAAQWLGRQDGPRWFITDGGFHGVMGAGADLEKYRQGTWSIMRSRSIEQHYSIADFLDSVVTVRK